MLKSTIFVIMYLHQSYQTSVSELRKVTTRNCTCPGDNQTYECTVVGDFDGITVWQGTVFNCEVGAEINLLHSQFVLEEGAFGSCNGGAIRGKSLRIENNRYISQLSVTISDDMNGETLECVYDDGRTANVIGNYSIDLTTVDFSVPAITDITWRASTSLLTVNWNTSVPDCPAINYNILASNCGSCPTTTNHTTVTCTGIVPTNHNVCSLTIQIVVCGNVSGNSSVVNQERIILIDADDIPNVTHNKGSISSDITTLRGYQGATATVGLLSILLIVCVAVLSLLLIKAKKELFEIITRTSNSNLQIQAISSHSPVSTVTVIDTKENIAYEHVTIM